MPNSCITLQRSGSTFEILAFIFPKDDKAGRKAKLKKYLTSVDNIEQLTGLDFLTSLNDSLEKELEKKKLLNYGMVPKNFSRLAC